MTAEGPVVDLLVQPGGRGRHWGTATDDLNATLLAWPAGEGPPEHVNDQRDVLVIVLEGWGRYGSTAQSTRSGARRRSSCRRRARRRITAGADGIRYLTVHLRRPGLQIERLGAP